jgi:hypothetical protein
MTQYFFYLHNGETTLPDLRAARAEAVRACGDILRDVSPTRLRQHGWRI